VNSILYTAIATLFAYLLGSIPTAVWFGKRFYNIDVREHGSGNAGATNTFRVLGKKAGAIVFSIDVCKGFLSTMIAYGLLYFRTITDTDLQFYQLLMGVVAVIGHIFPIFAGFRGGKGVATSLGMVLGIFPAVAGICFGVFVLVFGASNYVSLGSITAATLFPLLLMLPVFRPTENLMLAFGFVLGATVVAMHHKNIKKLLKGEESKTFLFKKQ
jgi:glycerol-3-phosphate acyltransferase PlsY